MAEDGEGTMPKRDLNTMSDAIALSSPAGRMSKRARKAAEKRLAEALFGKGGIPTVRGVKIPKHESLLRHAKRLRELAERGMSTRKYTKEAERLEAEAAERIKALNREE